MDLLGGPCKVFLFRLSGAITERRGIKEAASGVSRCSVA